MAAKYGNGSGKHFVRKSAIEEFTDYSSAEIERLRNSDETFDEAQYEAAVKLVLERLQQRAGEGTP